MSLEDAIAGFRSFFFNNIGSAYDENSNFITVINTASARDFCKAKQMQNAIQLFRLHGISSKTLVGRKWSRVHPLLQDKLFIIDCTRVVEEILLAERINGEMHFDEPLFVNSRAFVSVFQIACFPLREYDITLITAARMLLSHFESVIQCVVDSRFEYAMTWCFRAHLMRFIDLHKQFIDMDTAFLLEALAYRDYAIECVGSLGRDGEEGLIDVIKKDFERNERSIDLYLGGMGNDTFIFGL